MKSVPLCQVSATPRSLPPLFSSSNTKLSNRPNNFSSRFPLKSSQTNLRRRLSFFRCASDDNSTNNDGDKSDKPLRKDEKEQQQREVGENGGFNNNNSNGENGNGRPRLNLKWVDLLLDPDPDNVVAVGLTGVLAWASVQVLWQLFVISIAILLAALKYSFVAALLIFILITLL